MKKVSAVLSLAASFVMVSSPLFAHHSLALVDKDTLISFTGTVEKLFFGNPHTTIYFTTADGKKWAASGAAPGILRREAGWSNKTLQPGEMILIQGHVSKDGAPWLSFRGLYRCNGERIPLQKLNTDEYVTRVKLVAVEPDRVRAVCAGQATIPPQTAIVRAER